MVNNQIPDKLQEVIDDFGLVEDRNLRTDMLIYYADQFQEVPPEIAQRPFSDENKVPACESQAYVWTQNLQDGLLEYFFAVENPQGISAKAFSKILGETLSGAPLDQIINVDTDIIDKIFGDRISMGRDIGLRSLLTMVKSHALQKINS